MGGKYHAPPPSALPAGRNSYIQSVITTRTASDPVTHASEEGPHVAISVVAQIPGLTAEEDAALVEALALEGPPPAGGKVRLAGGGRRAAHRRSLGPRRRLRAFP